MKVGFKYRSGKLLVYVFRKKRSRFLMLVYVLFNFFFYVCVGIWLKQTFNIQLFSQRIHSVPDRNLRREQDNNQCPGPDAEGLAEVWASSESAHE